MSKTQTTDPVSVERAAQIVAQLEQELAEYPHAVAVAMANDNPSRIEFLDARRAILPDLIRAAKQQFYDARIATWTAERVALQAHADETRRVAAERSQAVFEAENALRAAMIAEQRATLDAQIASGTVSALDAQLRDLRREQQKQEAGQ